MGDAPGAAGGPPIADEEIAAVWPGLLATLPADVLPDDLGDEDRRLVTEVGLPTVHVTGFEFSHEPSEWRRHRGEDGRPYLTVSRPDSNMRFAIDLTTGRLVTVDIDLETHVFNRDWRTGVYFLGLLRRDVIMLEDTSEESLTQAVDALMAELRARDPIAVADARTQWSMMLEEIAGEYE